MVTSPIPVRIFLPREILDVVALIWGCSTLLTPSVVGGEPQHLSNSSGILGKVPLSKILFGGLCDLVIRSTGLCGIDNSWREILFPFYHSRFSEKHHCSVERMVSLRLACMFTLVGKASRLTGSRLRRLDNLVAFSSEARKALGAEPAEVDLNALTEARHGIPNKAVREFKRALCVSCRTDLNDHDRTKTLRKKWGSRSFRGTF